MRRGKKAILIDESGFDWQEVKLKRIGNTYVDPMTGKTWPLNGKPIRLNGKHVYLLDAEKGVILEPKKSEEVLNLKTNPEFLSTILEPEILHRAFKYRPSLRNILVAFVVGIGVGALFFAPMF